MWAERSCSGKEAISSIQGGRIEEQVSFELGIEGQGGAGSMAERQEDGHEPS